MVQSGIRPDFDFAKLAIDKYNLIIKKGAWFSMCDPETGEILEEDGKPVKVNGLLKVYDYLGTHPEYYAKLQKYVLNDINGVDASMAGIVPDDIEYVIGQNDAPGEA